HQIPIDLILMDIQMPEMDGIETTKRIREQEKKSGNHIPIVALTAGALKEEKEKCMAAGMDDFLTKPLQYKNLLHSIQKFLVLPPDLAKSLDKKELQKENPGKKTRFHQQDLMERIYHNEAVFYQLIDLAFSSDDVVHLEDAIQKKALDTIKKCAHKIKGYALNMSFYCLADLAKQLETALVQDVSQIPAIFQELKEEWHQILEMLKKVKENS
ncbi:MAG: response regulator, partial [Candidatus Brocadiae bacterium]|nr:response regulator [Candidatus Brocadiia bacterium]